MHQERAERQGQHQRPAPAEPLPLQMLQSAYRRVKVTSPPSTGSCGPPWAGLSPDLLLRLCGRPQGHPELENLRKNYFEWLIRTGQYDKAGVVKENQGDFQGAVNLYLKAGLPTKAARLAIEQPEVSGNSDSVSRIAASLVKGEFYERVSGAFLFFSPPNSSSRRRSAPFSSSLLSSSSLLNCRL